MTQRLFERREFLGVGAWALLGVSCRAQPPGPPGAGPSPQGAGPVVGAGLKDATARRFYAQRNGQPAWTEASAEALMRSLPGARAHGLDPALFAPTPGADSAERHDEALTLAALAYAGALAHGYVDPRKIQAQFTLARNEVDLAAGLQQALASGKLDEWLASLPPSDPEYQTLSAAYVAAIGEAGAGAAPAQGAPVGSSMAPTDRSRQLAANLERRRWLYRSPAARRIDVNTAGAFLAYFDADKGLWPSRVVCGRDDHQTPSIQASFHKLIPNPPWRVPSEIAKKEILPKGAGYMSRQHMRVLEGGRVEQAPGPQNALGLVKFDVQDPYDIYLHDTPAKALFAARERHKSHGCVRVQNALSLARLIADEANKRQEFEEALASGKTGEVDIGDPIPVRLLYHTAYLGAGNQVLLAPDVYGWDDDLVAALGNRKAAAGALRAESQDEDYGP